MWIFLVFTFLTFVVIVPVIAANVKHSQRGLDRISWNKYETLEDHSKSLQLIISLFSIVDPHDQPRLGAHVGVVYILTSESSPSLRVVLE